MSKGFLAAWAGLLAGASLVLGQAPSPPPTPPDAAPPASLPAPPPPPEAPHAPPPGFWDGFSFWDGWKGLSCSACAGPGGRGIMTFDADYVAWLFPKSKQDTTVSGVSPIDTNGFPTSTVTTINRIGDTAFERHVTNGARFSLGYWLTECQPAAPDNSIRTWGGEVRFFFVGTRSVTFENNASPLLIRPFFDLNNRRESGFPIAAPGLATGDLSATLQRNFWNLEGNVWRNLCHDYPETVISFDSVAGVRYMEFAPRLAINGTSVFDQNITAFPLYQGFSGNRLDMYESFATRNQFLGVQYGISGKLIFEDLIVSVTGKLALGVIRENIHIEGQELRTFPGGGQVLSQGVLLALPTNIGRFGKQKFGFSPDFDLNLTYPIWKHLSLKAGFEAVYWNRLVRPTDQVNRVIDITQIPNYPPAVRAMPTGLNQPTVPFRESDLWLIGGTAGFEIIW